MAARPPLAALGLLPLLVACHAYPAAPATGQAEGAVASAAPVAASASPLPAFVGGLDAPVALAFGANDTLYVAERGGRLLKAGRDGQAAAIKLDGPALAGAVDLAVGPDGLLRVAAGQAVLLVAPDGATGTLWQAPAATAGVAVDARGNVYVSAGSQVWRIDADGLAAPFAPAEDARGLALGQDGTLYVATREGVRALDPGGGAARTVLDGLQDPTGLALGPDGTPYVLDAGRIRHGQTAIAVPGGPRRLAFDHAGRLYAACEDAGAVVRLP